MPRQKAQESEIVIGLPDGTPLARVPGAIREEIRYLWTRLQLHGRDVPRSIGVTSQLAGEGVSFTSRALAVVLARAGETCLVESNWWNPSLRVGPENPGLAGLLQGRGTLSEVVVATNHAGLSIVPAGDLTESGQAVMANTAAMRSILDSLHTRFEFIVVDLPAILTSATALTFADATEASILVVRQRVTRIDQVESAVRDLRHTNLLGVIFNANKIAMPNFLQRRLMES